MLKSPVRVKPLRRSRGSTGPASTALDTALSTATATTAVCDADVKWEKMKDAVLMWTTRMKHGVGVMAEADKGGRLVHALLREAALADKRVWPRSIMTKRHADALKYAATGVRMTSRNNNVRATLPAPPNLRSPSECSSANTMSAFRSTMSPIF